MGQVYNIGSQQERDVLQVRGLCASSPLLGIASVMPPLQLQVAADVCAALGQQAEGRLEHVRDRAFNDRRRAGLTAWRHGHARACP